MPDKMEAVNWQVGRPRNDASSLHSSGVSARPMSTLSGSRAYINPDDDPRGPYRRESLLTQAHGNIWLDEFFGYRPPTGYGWKYSLERLTDFVADGRIDLRPGGPPVLRRYYAEHISEALRADPDEPRILQYSAELLLRTAMRDLAKAIAQQPAELQYVEWRDLERILREVLEGLGLATRLTPSSKDGGFDLEVTHSEAGQAYTYLVEVKHWRTGKPGRREYTSFVDVVVRSGSTSGLLLSSSGFSKELLHGRLEIEKQIVHLGNENKIVELCREYTRRSSGLWEQGIVVPAVLFDGTC